MYLYDPKGNALIPVVPGDIRALTYTQVDRFKDALLNLVYVADFQKMGDRKEEEKLVAAAMDTGFIAENVYLYCASENLPTCFRLSINREKFGQALEVAANAKDNGCSECRTSKRQIVTISSAKACIAATP